MAARSIRFTVAAWYTALLAATVCALAAAVYFTVLHATLAETDQGLSARMSDVGPWIVSRQRGKHASELAHEFATHLEGLQPGGMMLQVADGQGRWLYRSASMANRNVTLPSAIDLGAPAFETISTPAWHLRVLSARVQAGNQAFLVQLAQPLDAFYEILGRFRRLGLWLLPLVLGIAWGSGYIVCRHVLRPVDEITRTARSISAENLSLRLRVPPAHDELRHLSETLNAMIARLDAAFRRISEFTADAAHELRSPIALILTTSELALRQSTATADARGALEDIYTEALRSRELIGDLLMLARAGDGQEHASFGTVNLTELLRSASERGRVLAQAKGLTFCQNLTPVPVRVRGDAGSLERLFVIFLDNAVKFTPAPGRISVGLSQSNKSATVAVADSGPGIPATEMDRIFDRFYRMDRARSRDAGGAGLGLAIARSIAEAHGATIEVESSPNQGTTFRVSIPFEN